MSVKDLIDKDYLDWEMDWSIDSLVEEIAAIYARLYADRPDDAMALCQAIIPYEMLQEAVKEMYAEDRKG